MRSAVDFYERHPISAQIIKAKLEAERGNLDHLSPEALFAHDQDHYGGLAANDALAVRAGIASGTRVTDFCSGLGGPARYFAHRYGAVVTGIELTPSRVAGAQELTRLVGLDARVRILQGDVMDVPLPAASEDVVVSQEAFLHVPDLARTFAEAHRILRPAGRIAFTNWVAHAPLSAADSALMWDGMAARQLYSTNGHVELLERAGFKVESVDDLTSEWGDILRQRLAMYQQLRGEAERAGTPAGHDAFYASYIRFVDLVSSARLGGGRFVASKV